VATKEVKVKALTVRQPWAGQLVSGEKRIEYRTWRTDHRGPLLIHAGLSRADLGEGDDGDALAFGAIIGMVRLTDCRPRGGLWHWIVAEPVRLPRPVACSGQLSLWVPPRRVLAAVLAQLEK
jgi:hypothetical protein